MKSWIANLSVGTLLLTFTLFAPARSMAEPKIYLYTFNLENTPVKAAENLAKGLRLLKNKNCIDLRSTGSSSNDRMIQSGGVGLVLNEPLSEKEKEILHKAICAPNMAFSRYWIVDLLLPTAEAGLATPLTEDGWNSLKETCKVTISENSAPWVQVKINAQPLPPNIKNIPPLTPACKTGEYADSKNRGMSNPEAQKFKTQFEKWAAKRKKPSPFEYSAEIELTWPNEGLWRFGNSGMPTANGNKAIESTPPPDTLK